MSIDPVNLKQIEQLRRLSQESYEAGDYIGSRKHLETAVSLGCDDASVLSSLSYVCHLSGDDTAALKYGEHAKQFDPMMVDNYSNMAIALFGLKRYHQALIVLEEGLEIEPNNDNLWVNHGLALISLHKPIEAQASYAKALSINPNNVSAMTNQAIALQENGFAEAAFSLYQRVSKVNPNFIPGLSNSLMCAQYHPGLASQEILQRTREVASAFPKELPQSVAVQKRNSVNQPLRLGLYGPDLRAHPVGWFIRLVVPELAKRFDVYVYSSATQEDYISEEIRNSVKSWQSCLGWSDHAIIERSRNDGIDIAIDLTGHTAYARLAAFAQRIAPLQIAWLGFPASTGLAAIDAVLLSKDVVCEATPAFFTETIYAFDAPQFVYAPPSYIPAVTEPPCVKNGYVTFGCFNNLAKLNDSVVATWAMLMKAIPDSRLILKWKSLSDTGVVNSVLKRFFAAGIAQTRIELRGASEHGTMLKEYGDIDIALDPFPFSGALTSFEAAWMGLPVVTLASLRPMSRQTMSE